MDTATFIKQVRKDLDLTQSQLAKKIGKNRSNISLYETGLTKPPGDVILRLLEIRTPKCWSLLHFETTRHLCEKQEAI